MKLIINLYDRISKFNIKNPIMMKNNIRSWLFYKRSEDTKLIITRRLFIKAEHTMPRRQTMTKLNDGRQNKIHKLQD